MERALAQSQETRTFMVSGIVLLVGFCLTYLVISSYHRTQVVYRQARFESLVEKTTAYLQERVLSYEHGLRGTRGALLASGPTEMTRQKF